MAADIGMFGPGGESLGGLFVGNQMAQDEMNDEANRQKITADIANTHAITQQRELGNQYEGAILQDKIADFKQAAQKKQEDAAIAKFNSQGERFGQLGATLKGLPVGDRQAAVAQMAQQNGIASDNPMLQHLMQMDPETMPDEMMNYSSKFYEQGDKARAEKQKRDAMLAQEREKVEARNQQVADTNQMRRDIAAQASEDRRFLGGLAAGSRERVAAQRGANKGGLPYKSVDMAIANSVMNDPDMSEEEKREALMRLQLSKGVVGKPDTGPMIGLPGGQERITNAIRGGQAAPTPKAPSTEGGDIAAVVRKAGQQYEPDKYEYRVTPDGRVQRRAKGAMPPK